MTVKNTLNLILTVTLVFSLLSGCGAESTESQPALHTTETITAPATVPETTAIPNTIPETTVPETTVPETTVSEPTIPPFVVDGSYTYTMDDFLELLEQRLKENDCPIYLKYSSEFSPDENILVVSYRLCDSVSGEGLNSFDFHCDTNTGEILTVRIIDQMNHPVMKQFTAICLSIIDPSIEDDIYSIVSSRNPVGILADIYLYMMPGNGVVYEMSVIEDGDFSAYDLKISAENYFKESSPEWIDDVYGTRPTEQ